MNKKTKSQLKKEWEEIKEERRIMCGNICEYCGEKPATEGHHVFGRAKVQSLETTRMWDGECHRGTNYQKRVEETKVICSAELIEKYGEDEARKRAGGRLYFKSMITGK